MGHFEVIRENLIMLKARRLARKLMAEQNKQTKTRTDMTGVFSYENAAVYKQ